ncbi:MAG: hypothetical protein R2844_20290 [Caldilineales bacterium]
MTDSSTPSFFPEGQPAPEFTLTAVKSGRRVSQRDCRGTVLGLLFHGRDNYQAAVEINTAVRPVFPSAAEVTLASVLDLTIVPRLLQRAVKPLLEQAYDQAASQIPDGYDPADYVFLLPDWNGSLYKAFGVKNAEKIAALVIIDGEGTWWAATRARSPARPPCDLCSRPWADAACGCPCLQREEQRRFGKSSYAGSVVRRFSKSSGKLLGAAFLPGPTTSLQTTRHASDVECRWRVLCSSAPTNAPDAAGNDQLSVIVTDVITSPCWMAFTTSMPLVT